MRDMLEAFAAEYKDVRRINLVETPTQLLKDADRQRGWRFSGKKLLSFANWDQALTPNQEVLTIYTADDENEDEEADQWDLPNKEARLRIRAQIEKLLAEKNPAAVVLSQDTSGGLDPRWRQIKGQEGLVLKSKFKHERDPEMTPILLPLPKEGAPFGQWIARLGDQRVTVANRWDEGTKDLLSWVQANPGDTRAFGFFDDALRDADLLHRQNLLFGDWDLSNIGVTGKLTGKLRGGLHDFEGVVPVGSKPYLISAALKEALKENPGRFADKGILPADEIELAGICLRHLASMLEAKPPELYPLIMDMLQSRVTAAQAADRLDSFLPQRP